MEMAEHWAWQINDAINNKLTDATPEEVSKAMFAYRFCKGKEYAATFQLGQRWGLDTTDREALARIIMDNR